MTAFTWAIRLVSGDGAGIADAALELQEFVLDTGWQPKATARTDARGVVAQAIDDQAAAAVLPALRVTEPGAADVVIAATPLVSRAEGSGALTVDFGEVARLADSDRFTTISAVPRRKAPRLAAAATLLAAVPTPVLSRGGAGLSFPGTVGGVTARADRIERPTIERPTIERPTIERPTIERPDRLDVQLNLERISELQREIGARDVLVAEARRERDARIAELETSRAAAQTAEARRADLERLLQAKVAELAEVRATVASGASAQPQARLGVGDFATRIGGEVDTAQAALRQRGFTLGTLKVNAKGVLDGAGQIAFPGREELKEVRADVLSEVVLVFDPVRPQSPGERVVVPEVRQLTETAARRVLGSVGLRLVPAYGPGSIDPGSAEGQAMRQAPSPGAQAARGSEVTVIFAQRGTV